MKTRRRFPITSFSPAAPTALMFGIVAWVLLIGSPVPAVQAAAQQPPAAIAPIEAPFEMPQLRRPAFPDRTYDIRDYGAILCPWGDADRQKSTTAIHKAIEACHQAGGGKVLVPKGDWLTGAITLRSNVNLHLAEGAVLHFSNDLDDYLPVVHVRCEGVEAYN